MHLKIARTTHYMFYNTKKLETNIVEAEYKYNEELINPFSLLILLSWDNIFVCIDYCIIKICNFAQLRNK